MGAWMAPLAGMAAVPNQFAILDEKSVPSIFMAVILVATPAVSASRTLKLHCPAERYTGFGEIVSTTLDCGDETLAVTLMYCGAAEPDRMVTVLVYCWERENWLGSTVTVIAAGEPA